MNPIQLIPIGIVHNEAQRALDTGWGQVESTLVLSPSLTGALAGLEGFSHVIVVTWLHETPATNGVTRRPRGRADMPDIGVLAQRARHRPNPIGVTAAELVAVCADRLVVRGLDAIDGTPVLDIKPYYPVYDRRNGTVPTWVDELMKGYF